jgi:hypothetical protein
LLVKCNMSHSLPTRCRVSKYSDPHMGHPMGKLYVGTARAEVSCALNV